MIKNLSVVNAKTLSSSITKSIPQKKVIQFNTNIQNLNADDFSVRLLTNTGVFHSFYNFFNTETDPTTYLVPNDKYLNIFNNQVAVEVKYVLDRINTSLPWSDVALNDLDSDKIAISISPSLLEAFRGIHSIGSTEISLTWFLDMLVKSLKSGTLDEIDPNYFFRLAESQRNDAVINYTQASNESAAAAAALGLISQGASSADYNSYLDLSFKRQLKRQRRLNTDINSTVDIIQYDGNDAPLKIKNYGVDVVERIGSSEKDSAVGIGDGAGYYLSTIDISNIENPFVVTNDISASYYMPPSLRHNVLSILGVNSDVKLTTNSLATGHEFHSQYTPEDDISTMYFSLDLKSVSSNSTSNQLIENIFATYNRITDMDADTHSRNYSLNIIKINLDYNDPFIRYARDSSSILLNQNDMSLAFISELQQSVNNIILTKNIPFALIVTPGNGVDHNPFRGESSISNIGDTIQREISIIPHINHNSNESIQAPLDKETLTEDFPENYFGLYERTYDVDPQGVMYQYNASNGFFSNGYYNGNSYSNNQPPVESRRGSTESQIVKLIDNLVEWYSVTSITWWDVFVRLTSNQLAFLYEEKSSEFIRKLSSGWRGVTILNVLYSETPVFTRIPLPLNSLDIIIMTEEDRRNAQSYR